MITIPTPQTPPEMSSPSLSQAVRFFTPGQKRILIVSSVVFFAVLIASGAAFYLWLTSFKKSLIDFDITGPSQIASGEVAEYIISYWNNTNQILQNAALTIRYPEETVIDGEKSMQNFDLGSIGIGGGGSQKITLAFTGADKSVEKLEAILNYKPQNTTSTFENSAVKETAINGSALEIDFKTPESVLPNARNIYTIRYKNNSDEIFQNVSVELTYSSEFVFISADKTPSKDGNIWNLGDLNPNEEGDINIIGIIKNVHEANFESAIGIVKNGKFYKFGKSSSQINLTEVPINIDISVNGQKNIDADPGDLLDFEIHYENKADISLANVTIKVEMQGAMYNFTALETSGYFSGVNNAIAWNAGNHPDFKSLPPGASGDLAFRVGIKPQYAIGGFRDKNFLLTASARMETPTVPASLAVDSLSASSDAEIKINTKVEIKVQGYYYDQVIKNSGPLPPKVNQTTTYAIHWKLTNYSNDVDGAVVKAALPEGVNWLNNKSGAGGATLEYDQTANEVIWNIGKLPAGTGILLNPYEVVFQLGLTPAANKAGMAVSILGESKLTGTDAFTGGAASAAAPALKTDLPDDPGVDILKSRVEQ